MSGIAGTGGGAPGTGGTGGGGVGSAASAAAPASLSSSAPDLAPVADTTGGGVYGQSPMPQTPGGIDQAPLPPSRPQGIGINDPSVSTIQTINPTATAAAPANSNKSGGILSSLTSNPLAALSLAGMGSNLLKGNKQPAYAGTLASNAGNLAAQGNLKQNYLTSGTLPPGQQAAVDSAVNAQVAGIRSKYAQLGQSGSTAEMSEIASAHNSAVQQGAQIAAQLSAQGLSETQMANTIYEKLMNTSIQQDANLQSGIGNLANAMALMSGRRVA